MLYMSKNDDESNVDRLGNCASSCHLQICIHKYAETLSFKIVIHS